MSDQTFSIPSLSLNSAEPTPYKQLMLPHTLIYSPTYKRRSKGTKTKHTKKTNKKP